MESRLLLTGLGLRPNPGQYRLGEITCEASFSPSALCRLLPESPHRVLVFCTADARVGIFPKLQDELRDFVPVEPVDVPPGVEPDDLDQFLQTMVSMVDESGAERILLDLTQGPRHFSLLLYMGASYLQTLKRTTVEAAYYCFENFSPRPFFDLRQLLVLPAWIHAIENFTTSFDMIPMATLVKASGQSLAARDLPLLTEAFHSGLPVELGFYAGRLVDDGLRSFARTLCKDHALPLSQELIERLRDQLEKYRLPRNSVPGNWKATLQLNRDELERQARIVDDLLGHNNLRSALALMREWVISWVLFQDGQTASWLDSGKLRERVSRRLSALMRINQDRSLRTKLAAEQGKLAEFWKDLIDLRNSLAHHGMRRQVVSSNDPDFAARLERVRDYWRGTLRAMPAISLHIQPLRYRRLLVSPIGERPGVLYSAVLAAGADGTPPDAVMAICSARSEQFVQEALEHAGGPPVTIRLRLDDPFAGLEERKRILAEARPHLLESEHVVVNITGGTTLMGLLAETITAEARSLGIPVRRFGLIDRRPPQEQTSNPYVAGEPLWLEDATDEVDHD